MSSRVPSPYDIAVKVWDETDWPQHSGIQVRAKAYELDVLAERYTLAEVAIGWRTIAGQLGRLAILLAPHVITARTRHGCSGFESCQIDGTGLVSLEEQLNYGSGPVLDLAIPTSSKKEFRDRVKKALGEITAADRIPVTPEAELEWQPQQRLHLRSVSR